MFFARALPLPEETGGITREDIRLALAEDAIEARPVWKPMHLQPVFCSRGLRAKGQGQREEGKGPRSEGPSEIRLR